MGKALSDDLGLQLDTLRVALLSLLEERRGLPCELVDHLFRAAGLHPLSLHPDDGSEAKLFIEAATSALEAVEAWETCHPRH